MASSRVQADAAHEHCWWLVGTKCAAAAEYRTAGWAVGASYTVESRTVPEDLRPALVVQGVAMVRRVLLEYTEQARSLRTEVLVVVLEGLLQAKKTVVPEEQEQEEGEQVMMVERVS